MRTSTLLPFFVPIAVFVTLSGLGACALHTSGLTFASSTGGSGGAGPGTGGSGGHGGTPATCASSDCEEIPQGWTVVRARRQDPSTTSDASAPTCADGSSPAVYFHHPSTAGCTPCMCDQPMGAACSSPQVTCSFSTADCSTNDVQQQDDSDTCKFHLPPAVSNSSGSCKLTAPAHVTSTGTCSTTGGEVTPAAPWAGTILVCRETASGSGCGAGQTCLPTGATADGSVCITRPDGTACPTGWTGEDTLAFESGTDTRTCNECACNVQCSGGDFVAYDDDFCNDSNSVKIDSTTCVAVPDIFDYSQASLQSHVGTPMLASCDGGDAFGTVQPTGAHRICCR